MSVQGLGSGFTYILHLVNKHDHASNTQGPCWPMQRWMSVSDVIQEHNWGCRSWTGLRRQPTGVVVCCHTLAEGVHVVLANVLNSLCSKQTSKRQQQSQGANPTVTGNNLMTRIKTDIGNHTGVRQHIACVATLCTALQIMLRSALVHPNVRSSSL